MILDLPGIGLVALRVRFKAHGPLQGRRLYRL